MQSSPKVRIFSVLIYSVGLSILQHFVVKSGLLPNENSIWLYNGIAGLLFGSRLLYPYFTPPADAATNSFAALTSMIAGALAVTSYTGDAYVLGATAAFAGLIFLGSLSVLIARPAVGIEPPLWVRGIDRLVRQLGAPNVIFTIVILASVWLFHRARPTEVFFILGVWATIALLKPVEAISDYLGWVLEHKPNSGTEGTIGIVAAYQTPDIALIRQSSGGVIGLGSTLLVPGERGTWLLGIALNYVGRDEGNLLRTLTAPLPPQLASFATGRSPGPSSGAALHLVIPDEEVPNIVALEWINRLCGIVDSDTTFEFLRFEVVEEAGLSEGRLVEARIGEHRSVLYQLIEGVTRDEIVQQKNKYGFARAKARKIGYWDEGLRKFRHVPWLPRINCPVFLMDTEDFHINASDIGHFPRTRYGVSINVSDAVSHNTAILGILGIGKTYLAAELIERMLANGIKVICLDLTNQYASLLAPFIDEVHDAQLNQELLAAGANGTANASRELGGSKRAFKERVREQLIDFMAPENERLVRILNPAQFEVTRQGGGMFNGNAELSTLTPCEITSIFSDVALAVCQALGMSDQARLCLVYEEAHSLVPEWNAVASDGDKTATSVTARAILQGRKYGLGCLLITQRTANVTKTILNQCNTIIAMRTFDDTGKDFLSNYIGGDYAGVLPSLEARHAVVFGKASSCENPVLVRLNDREPFLATFRELHPPKPLPAVAVEQPAPAILPIDVDLDDEIPF